MFSGLYDVSGPRNYGLATGVMNAIGGLGAGSAILIAGIWRSSIGIEPLMRGCLVLSMSCAILLFFVLKGSSKRELTC
jgi:nitrate/nitrite transporter NarK